MYAPWPCAHRARPGTPRSHTQHPRIVVGVKSHLKADHPALLARRVDQPVESLTHLPLGTGPRGQLHDEQHLRSSRFGHGDRLPRNYITMYHQNIMNVPQPKAGRPRNQALDGAILSAAARQLGELGYARMSLESVAAAAGTTVPSLRRRTGTRRNWPPR